MEQAFVAALKAVLTGVQLGIEDRLDSEQQALQSREWTRAMRAQKAQAMDALTRGAAAAGALKMRGTQLEGQQRLSYAMGSVDATSGTAASTIASSRFFNAVDVETTRNNARREALGHQTAVMQLEDWGRQQSQARKARDASRGLRGVGSVLSIAGAAGAGGM